MLQAVVVDDFDNVQGVISMGDILRFMVYPTDEVSIYGDTLVGEMLIYFAMVRMAKLLNQTSEQNHHWCGQGQPNQDMRLLEVMRECVLLLMIPTSPVL